MFKPLQRLDIVLKCIQTVLIYNMLRDGVPTGKYCLHN